MQKMVYLSNSRDYLEQGCKVAHITPSVVELENDISSKPSQRETFVAFVLLEKNALEK